MCLTKTHFVFLRPSEKAFLEQITVVDQIYSWRKAVGSAIYSAVGMRTNGTDEGFSNLNCSLQPKVHEWDYRHRNYYAMKFTSPSERDEYAEYYLTRLTSL